MTYILETRQVFSGCVEAFEDVAKEKGNCVRAIPDNSKCYQVTNDINVREVTLLAQWKGQSPSKHCNKSNIRLLLLLHNKGLLSPLLQGGYLTLTFPSEKDSNEKICFTQQITPLLPLFYSKTGGARADLIHPLCICWHLEESLANLFSAGSSVSEKVFNHDLFAAVRTSTKHTSRSLLERGNYWESDQTNKIVQSQHC